MKAYTFIILTLGFTVTVQAYGKTNARHVVFTQLGIKSNTDVYCIKSTPINNK